MDYLIKFTAINDKGRTSDIIVLLWWANINSRNQIKTIQIPFEVVLLHYQTFNELLLGLPLLSHFLVHFLVQQLKLALFLMFVFFHYFFYNIIYSTRHMTNVDKFKIYNQE